MEAQAIDRCVNLIPSAVLNKIPKIVTHFLPLAINNYFPTVGRAMVMVGAASWALDKAQNYVLGNIMDDPNLLGLNPL